jgi:hypothetical protein
MNMLRHPALLALLLVPGVICGCNKEETTESFPSANLVGRLEPGVETSVRMWGSPADYVYEGTAGEVVSLSVTSRTPGLDPNVQLLDPAGNPEAFDDDGGGQGNALIQGHTLGSSGIYRVRLRTDEDRTGELAILLNVEGNGPDPEMTTTAIPLEEPHDEPTPP